MKRRPFYRLKQLWIAIAKSPSLHDLERVHSILLTDQFNLFSKLQSSEQIHAINVMDYLIQKGHDHQALLIAALLHDIGKTVHPLSLWDRIMIVLGKAVFPGRVKAWGKASIDGWKRAFVIAEQHPAWGAELAKNASVSHTAVSLIERHSDTLPDQISEKDFNIQTKQFFQLLQEADNQN